VVTALPTVARCHHVCRVHGQLDHLFDHAVSLSLTLADAAATVGSDPAAQSAVEAVQEGSKSGGFFGPIALLFENTLKVTALACTEARSHTCKRLSVYVQMPQCSSAWLRLLRYNEVKLPCFPQLLDNGLAGLHIPYSYGFAIILLTIIVKILTFPLTKKQVSCFHRLTRP
jgi:hypothetical protein